MTATDSKIQNVLNEAHLDASDSCPELSIATQFFFKSTKAYIDEAFSSLFKSQKFERDLSEFSRRMVPNMLALLRKNLIANPEKQLLERIEDQLVYLDQRAKAQSTETDATKINKEAKLALLTALQLEKLFLTEEATRSGVKKSGSDAQQDKAGNVDGPAAQDIWEKRQLKAMRKLRKQLISNLQSLQLHLDIKASMAEDESSPGEEVGCTSGANTCETQSYESFTDFVRKVMIEPLGGRLYQSLLELTLEMDLPDSLITELKSKGQSQGVSSRRHLRKPTTPSKILKKTFETKQIQTESVPLQNLSSGINGAASIGLTQHPLQRKSSEMSIEVSQMSVSSKPPANGSTVQQFLGKRNKRLLIQNSELLAAADSNVTHQNKSVGYKKARHAAINNSDGSQQESSPNLRQNRAENSHESQVELVNLCDITSSFQSCGSHTISTSLAKKPLEQVNNLKSLSKNHNSLGFPDQANYKQAMGPRASSGPGFLSQRTCPVDSGRRFAASRNAKQNEQPSFKMKKTHYSRKLGGAQTSSLQIKTKKPPKAAMSNAKIVNIGGMPQSVNLSKKQSFSQQSSTMASFLKRRQQKTDAQNATPSMNQPLSQVTRHNSQSNCVTSSQQSIGLKATAPQLQPLGLTPSNSMESRAAKKEQPMETCQSREQNTRINDIEILGL